MATTRYGALPGSFSRIGTHTVTSMDEPHDELLAIADAMDRLVDRARQPDVQEPLVRLERRGQRDRKIVQRFMARLSRKRLLQGLAATPSGCALQSALTVWGTQTRTSQTTGDWLRIRPRHD